MEHSVIAARWISSLENNTALHIAPLWWRHSFVIEVGMNLVMSVEAERILLAYGQNLRSE